MMLSRFVRWQLAVFAVLTVVGLTLMSVRFLRVPEALGVGRITVTVELPGTGGLYERANVTYRGVTVGRVRQVRLTDTGVEAVMTLPDDARIPSDGLAVNVHSMSAIGEQYIDLVPASTGAPYLHDGQAIGPDRATLPQAVGPVLDQADALLDAVPDGALDTLVDETYTGFAGASDEFSRLVRATRQFLDTAGRNADAAVGLLRDAQPLLDSQVRSEQSIRAWAEDLAGITGRLAESDAHVRSIFDLTAPTADAARTVLDETAPALPTLLRNLNAGVALADTYHSGIEQLLVLFPPLTAAIQTVVNGNLEEQKAVVDFHMQFGDPPACLTGYLPPGEWRMPTATDTPPTPSDLYCKVPQDARIAVRGARNLPCAEHPGKRAPTPELCDDPRGYVPQGDNPPFPPASARGNGGGG
ncbi:MCE family protein [Tomitella fengzijianii]|uniref:MCE family protein n=1 Tax=Tomitella fengzijianii TaxID=2597660 RepID=A0A516X6L4_9ACTN|nr:MlaD family protein [Tomitella fengzijianii]QDQ98653.1 MCE family protein [Tomitella fengzijianii]